LKCVKFRDTHVITLYYKTNGITYIYTYFFSPVKDTVVTNDRWGVGTSCKHGGYYSCADRFNPGTLQTHKWENAMTIDKQSWGFRRETQLSDYLTIHELITTLAETVR
jgi:alpha-L-fucosidase